MANKKPPGAYMNPKAAWKANLSAAHRGPRPGKVTVQKAPRLPTNKVRWT